MRLELLFFFSALPSPKVFFTGGLSSRIANAQATKHICGWSKNQPITVFSCEYDTLSLYFIYQTGGPFYVKWVSHKLKEILYFRKCWKYSKNIFFLFEKIHIKNSKITFKFSYNLIIKLWILYMNNLTKELLLTCPSFSLKIWISITKNDYNFLIK